MIDLIDYIERCSSRKSTYRLADFFNRWWDEYAQHPAEYMHISLGGLFQPLVGRVRTAPCGVHHPRTVQGGERYPCVPYSRFGNRHIRLSRLRGGAGNQS